MFYGQGVSAIIQVGSSEKTTPMLIEIIDGWSFSLRPITHETKPLNVTISSHTSKIVFNVISFLRNLVIIGLSWFVLHNS